LGFRWWELIGGEPKGTEGEVKRKIDSLEKVGSGGKTAEPYLFPFFQGTKVDEAGNGKPGWLASELSVSSRLLSLLLSLLVLVVVVVRIGS